MSDSSRVTLQRGRKRLMPAGIEHMLVHLTGRRDLLTSRWELCPEAQLNAALRSPQCLSLNA
jgi:hypothetical protein